MVRVELVYVPANDEPVQVWLEMQDGDTVADAIQQSGLLKKLPDIAEMTVGIFSKPVPLETKIKEGDRIEFYRPLLIDPKEKRRQRARPPRKP